MDQQKEKGARGLSLAEIEPGARLWAYARGHWRLVRVERVLQKRVLVTYALRSGPMRFSRVPPAQLRREMPHSELTLRPRTVLA